MLILRVDDDGALKRAVDALREIEKQIPRSIKAEQRDSFRDGAKQAKANLGGGSHLRPAIARGTRAEGGASGSNSLIADKVLPSAWNPGGYDLPAAVNASNRYMVGGSRTSYSGGWKHPTWGRGTPAQWPTQQSPAPRWYTNVAEDLDPRKSGSPLRAKWVDLLEEAAEYVASRV